MIEGELGSFIRSRREAVSPTDVGLPLGPRRRTPGLRRAELATLAGVSVDYLTRIEQGKDTRPSTEVLAALADVLRLTADEISHLNHLASVARSTALCPEVQPAAAAVRPTILALLKRLEPSPAFVMNHLTDLLAWTDGYANLVGPLGALDGPRPNLLRYTFTDERSRRHYPDWEHIADEQTANLHSDRRGPEDEAEALIAELEAEAGEAFSGRWRRNPVSRKRTGTKTIAHPEAGMLRLSFETLELPDADRQRLVVYLPADEASAAELDGLSGRRPGALRPVSDAAGA